MYATLNELKQQLNIETSFTDDDSLLNNFIAVAGLAVENYLQVSLTGYTGTTLPTTIKQAIVMLAAHYYINRNIVSFAQGFEIPYTFQFLLNPYKNYIIV